MVNDCKAGICHSFGWPSVASMAHDQRSVWLKLRTASAGKRGRLFFSYFSNGEPGECRLGPCQICQDKLVLA